MEDEVLNWSFQIVQNTKRGLAQGNEKGTIETNLQNYMLKRKCGEGITRMQFVDLQPWVFFPSRLPLI